MFSEHFMNQLYPAYERLLSALGSKREQVESAVKAATVRNASEGQALICLYASMPLSDAVSYPVSLFESFAKHGVFLWEKGPFAGRIPEMIFAAYVLHHRVNNEDLADCRPFFHGELVKALPELSGMTESVLAVNYWCASKLTYRSSDERTANPITLYHTGYGRCGEESTFLVTALRSVGIPARQVYVPLWSHCDDNHAWVEVWCDGKWNFLGACEPDEILNRGWFTHAASRAMMVHSRWFLPCEPSPEITKIAADTDSPLDCNTNQAAGCVNGCTSVHADQNRNRMIFCGSQGMVRLLNHLPRYARTRVVTVTVRDEDGTPLSDVPVHFSVMNEAAFVWIADGKTDANGNCSLVTGQGALLISAVKPGYHQAPSEGSTPDQSSLPLTEYHRGEFLLPAGEDDTACVTIRFAAVPDKADAPETLTLDAPKDAPLNRTVLSSEEQKKGAKKLANAREMHCQKVSLLPKYTPEIARFLAEPTETIFPEEIRKDALLSVLPPKDLQDVTAEVILESCHFTAACHAESENIPEDILYLYLLNPRVDWEPLRPHRAFLSGLLTTEQQEQFRRHPEDAWNWIDRQITSLPELEYDALVTSAEGAFACGHASLLSKKILTVQLLRTLGTPARLHAIDKSLEFWQNGSFLPIHTENKTGILHLTLHHNWRYGVDWSLSVLKNGIYQPIRLTAKQLKALSAPVPEPAADVTPKTPVLTLSLPAGQYRLLTANRLPNGNLLAEKQDFRLEEGNEQTLAPQIPEASLSSMLSQYDVTDFALRRENISQSVSEHAAVKPDAPFSTPFLSELTGDGRALFLWLEEGKEPTEHILREMWERENEWNKIQTPVYFILRDRTALSSPVLKQTLAALPHVQILFDDFDNGNCERLARRMYLEPGQFPLVVVLQSLSGLYGTAGYHVGAADLLLRILTD